MPNVLKFPKSFAPSATGIRAADGSGAENHPGPLRQPLKNRREVRDIILLLDLAALQLRRADAMNSGADSTSVAKEYLSRAEELIDIARRIASADLA